MLQGRSLQSFTHLTVWSSCQSRQADLLTVCVPVLQRSTLLDRLEREPFRGQSFTVNFHALTLLLTLQHLELITFRTPSNAEAKRLLQFHVRRWADTAEVHNVIAGRHNAGRCISSAYSLGSTTSEQYAEYVCLWAWHSVELRE